MELFGYTPPRAAIPIFSPRQWLWTVALVTFILAALYDNLEWSPVLVPSALLIWYGAIRASAHGRQE